MRAPNKGGKIWATSKRKRGVDLIFSGLLFVVSSPVLLFVLLWSAISFRANPLIRQTRVGLGGSKFKLLKIRTLPTSVPPNLSREELDELVRPGKVAKVIRKSHLDELPQFLNVFVGHMSLVGPRPMIQEIVDALEPGFASVRHAVRPGVTGLWQISTKGARQLSPVEGLDVEYVTNATPSLDIRVLAATLTQAVGLTNAIDPAKLVSVPSAEHEAEREPAHEANRLPQGAVVAHD